MLKNALRSFTLSVAAASTIAVLSPAVVSTPASAADAVCGAYTPPVPFPDKDYLATATPDIKALFATMKTKLETTSTGVTLTLIAHEVKGGYTQDRVYHISELCPGVGGSHPAMATATVVSGSGQLADPGAVAVWRGGLKIKGHQGPPNDKVKIIADLTDPRATSLLGRTINEVYFDNMLMFGQTTGPLKADPDATISIKTEGGTESHACKVVEFTVDNPAKDHGITLEKFYVDATTSYITRHEGFINGTLVEQEDFSKIEPTSSLTPDQFNL
jgi:hypothetical protein